MPVDVEWLLDLGLSAVPEARRLSRSYCSDHAPDLADDAELVVAELVTNAVLHGGAPVHLRLRGGPSCLRIEVADGGSDLPVLPQPSADSMTGRGLGLVAALVSAWGVDRAAPGGKVVWTELSPLGAADPDELEVNAEALLDLFDEEPQEELFTVQLGAVPTDLLLAAKGHIDNLVREFALAGGRRGARSEIGASAPVPELERLVEAATVDWASARAEIKRQALAAARDGQPETLLVLRQPASAADAGERYLAALDEADRYARAARLLTLESPPLHRLFRRWYVQSLVDQVRAQATGAPPPTVPTFAKVLADEVSRSAVLHEAWDRLELLQTITAELTAATSVEQIAAVVTGRTEEFLGAVAARVYLLGDDDVLRAVDIAEGNSSGRDYGQLALDADLPGPVVTRTGQPMVLRGLARIAERFPSLADVYDSDRTLHVVPLVVDEHRIGVLSLAFPPIGELDERTRARFVTSLADALAQALERAAAASAAEQAGAQLAEANARLAFVADASVSLWASLDVEATVKAVTDVMVPRLADWCVVQVLDGAELTTVSIKHSDPTLLAWAHELSGRYPTRMDAPNGAPNVIRTGRSELHSEIPHAVVEQAAIDADHLDVIRRLGMNSALVVPLIGRTGPLGAITLIFTDSGRRYTDADVPFAEDVARRAALALENATAFHEQSGRLAHMRRIAEAAQEAILAPPPDRVGPVSLRARYLSAAKEALVGGDLYEVVPRRESVRLLVGDVRGKGLTAVRTATIVLGEFRAAAADIDDLTVVARQVDRRLRPYLGDEDFVTAIMADIQHDGTLQIANCGHPPALRVTAGTSVAHATDTTPTLPLGLGADPALWTGHLRPGERLLLYTDGAIEARDANGRFIDLTTCATALNHPDMDQALDSTLTQLREAAGGELNDDLALLMAEFVML